MSKLLPVVWFMNKLCDCLEEFQDLPLKINYVSGIVERETCLLFIVALY